MTTSEEAAVKKKDRGTRNWQLVLFLQDTGEKYLPDKPCREYMLPRLLESLSAIRYAIARLRRHEDYGWHYQCYLETANSKTASALTKYLGNSHIQLYPRVGSRENAVKLRKDSNCWEYVADKEVHIPLIVNSSRGEATVKKVTTPPRRIPCVAPPASQPSVVTHRSPTLLWYWGVPETDHGIQFIGTVHAGKKCYMKEDAPELWPGYQGQTEILLQMPPSASWSIQDLIRLGRQANKNREAGNDLTTYQVATGYSSESMMATLIIVICQYHHSQLFAEDVDYPLLLSLIDEEAQFPTDCFCPRCMEYRIEEVGKTRWSVGCLFDVYGRKISQKPLGI